MRHLVLLLALTSCGEAPSHPFTEVQLRRVLSLSPLGALPPDPTNHVADDPRAQDLGRRLFFDRRLSGDGETSCATCHDPEVAFGDGKPIGREGLRRHTPSLWNAGHQRWFFWDGRADSLWAQALQPLEDPLEHGSTRLQIAHVLYRDPELRRSHEDLFGTLPDLEDAQRFPPSARPLRPEDSTRWRESHGGRTHPDEAAWLGMSAMDQELVTAVFVNVGKAIAAHVRRIRSDDAPFDRYVTALRNGDRRGMRVLDEAAVRGLALFVGRGQCFLCHSGPDLTDREFHDIGLPNPRRDPGRARGLALLSTDPFRGDGLHSDEPQGSARLKLDTLPPHLHGGAEFKTPTLRNVARSAPYMHDGSLPDLRAVLEHYSKLDSLEERGPLVEAVLQPLELEEGEIADLLAFLNSLTDESRVQELGPPVD